MQRVFTLNLLRMKNNMGCPNSIVPGLNESLKATKGQDPALAFEIERALNESERKQKKVPKKKPQPPLTS